MRDLVKDFIQVSSYALKATFSKLGKVYLVFAFILLRLILQDTGMLGISAFGSIGGFVNYLVDVLVLSFVVQALRAVVIYGNPGKKSVQTSINTFFQPLLSTMFYLYIINLLVDMLVMGASQRGAFVVSFIVKLLTSALPEEVYIGNKHGFYAVSSSVKFVIDNPLTYGLISAIFILVESLLMMNLQGLGINTLITIIIIAVIRTFFCVIRGHIFKYTDEHPYRQRKFMRG